MDKWFDTTSEAKIREWIGTIHVQGILGLKGKYDMRSLNTSGGDFFPPQTLYAMVLEGIDAVK